VDTLGQRNRWYDIPLSREESLQADKKLSVTFSCSQDPEGVIIVDSVKVYGRNKEAFGWPEENEENGICPTTSKNSTEVETNQSKSWRAAGVERLACALLEVLELALSADGPGVGTVSSRQVATRLLCLPSPSLLHSRCKALLKSLLGSQYHLHKV
jgi:E3 ubiquitin-protein ligase UBR4